MGFIVMYAYIEGFITLERVARVSPRVCSSPCIGRVMVLICYMGCMVHMRYEGYMGGIYMYIYVYMWRILSLYMYTCGGSLSVPAWPWPAPPWSPAPPAGLPRPL
jgi:hypothetical protein